MEDKTILYVEDNIHNRRIVRKILGRRGFTVIEAEDGLVGYKMICDLKPPLVLLDIALPHLDGIQIVQRLKADSKLRHIPVVALTASAMRGDRERFLEAGCDDYLSKPVRADELVKMVEKYYVSDNGNSNAAPKKRTMKKVVQAASKTKEEKPEEIKMPVQEQTEVTETLTAEEDQDKPVKAKKKTTKAKKNTKTKNSKSKKAAKVEESEDSLDAMISNNIEELFTEVASQLQTPDISTEPLGNATIVAHGINGSGSATIWVMDDNPGDSRLLRRVLGAKLKVKPIEVSPSKAPFATQEQTPQLIVFGVRRPDDTMYQVLNTIRAQEKIADVPIFLLATEGFDDFDKENVAKYVDLAWSKDHMLHTDLLANILNILARKADSKKKVSNPVEARPSRGQQESATSEVSVLVIEDIADSANLASKILQSHQYNALVADSGEAGLNQALEHKPDLILLDLGLPDVDGQTLLGFLKAEDALMDTPVVVCTAWPKESLKEIVESYGFDGYISKPYKVAEFMKVVKAFTP